jgi:chromate transporter
VNDGIEGHMKNNRLLQLFLTFLKIGALTFGGGYAMMPVMRKEVVDKKGWVDDEDILKILVISESTPGVLAVNSATFIGYKIKGFWGSVVATLGVIIPSLIIISVISIFLYQYRDLELVSYAFLGIKAGIAVLIFQAGLKLSKKLNKNGFTYIVFSVVLAVALFTTISAIYLIIIGALIGLIYGHIKTIKVVSQDAA